MKSAMISAGDVLKNFKKNTEAGMKAIGPSTVDLMKKIVVLEKEAAVACAIETFLDCDYQKVKVSKRVPKGPSTWSGIRMKGAVYNRGAQKIRFGAGGIS